MDPDSDRLGWTLVSEGPKRYFAILVLIPKLQTLGWGLELWKLQNKESSFMLHLLQNMHQEYGMMFAKAERLREYSYFYCTLPLSKP